MMYDNNSYQKSFWIIIFVCLYCVHSASIMTSPSSTTNHQLAFISNETYRYFFLRQYFLNLINTSHSTYLQSMIQNRQFTVNLEQIKARRRRQISLSPISTIYSTECSVLNSREIRNIFHLTESIQSSQSIELIIHINSQKPLLPIHLLIKHSQTFSKIIYLKYDSFRNYYSINLRDYISFVDHSKFTLEIIQRDQTCLTSHVYLIVSSIKLHRFEQNTNCKLKQLNINFQDLGLAHLIIRPKEYLFTYCEGSCPNSLSQNQLSVYTLFQSLIGKKHENQCQPIEYSDENFLLRQPNGNLQIYPIERASVKQCACL